MEDAHALSYAHVVSYLEVRVIQLLEVAQLSFLCLLYRKKLDDKSLQTRITGKRSLRYSTSKWSCLMFLPFFNGPGGYLETVLHVKPLHLPCEGRLRGYLYFQISLYLCITQCNGMTGLLLSVKRINAQIICLLSYTNCLPGMDDKNY